MSITLVRKSNNIVMVEGGIKGERETKVDKYDYGESS